MSKYIITTSQETGGAALFAIRPLAFVIEGKEAAFKFHNRIVEILEKHVEGGCSMFVDIRAVSGITDPEQITADLLFH